MNALNIKMSKDLMKQRIQEALSGDPAQARRRVEVCLWGLEHAKNGPAMVNELIDELGLQAHGQAKRELA
jgi:hypothetical protein